MGWITLWAGDTWIYFLSSPQDLHFLGYIEKEIIPNPDKFSDTAFYHRADLTLENGRKGKTAFFFRSSINHDASDAEFSCKAAAFISRDILKNATLSQIDMTEKELDEVKNKLNQTELDCMEALNR